MKPFFILVGVLAGLLTQALSIKLTMILPDGLFATNFFIHHLAYIGFIFTSSNVIFFITLVVTGRILIHYQRSVQFPFVSCLLILSFFLVTAVGLNAASGAMNFISYYINDILLRISPDDAPPASFAAMSIVQLFLIFYLFYDLIQCLKRPNDNSIWKSIPSLIFLLILIVLMRYVEMAFKHTSIIIIEIAGLGLIAAYIYLIERFNPLKNV